MIVSRVVNFCWSCFKWCLVLGSMGAVAVLLYHDRVMDDQIRHRVQQCIADHYPDLEVAVESATFCSSPGSLPM